MTTSDDGAVLPRPWAPSVDERTIRIAEALRELDVQHRRFGDAVAHALHPQPSEFKALTLIGDGGQVTPKHLAAELHLSTGAVTAMIDRLEASGLVIRHSHPTDRRSILVQLSRDGELKRDWVYDNYTAAVADYCTITTPEFADAFLTCLGKAARAVERQVDALA